LWELEANHPAGAHDVRIPARISAPRGARGALRQKLNDQVQLLTETEGKRPIALVVEDEPIVMLGAVQMFETAGFEALVAFTADEAIAHLEGRSDIALVFTDCELPGSMDGPALAHQVRSRWPTIEIIVVSGPRRVDGQTLPLGVRFFPKPYSQDQIERAVHDLGVLRTMPRARQSL
jgi:CheY-like chemotaxis protein